MLGSAYIRCPMNPLLRRAFALSLLISPLAASAAGPGKAQTPPPPETPPPAPPSTVAAMLFGAGNVFDTTYDELQKFKLDNHLPITIGAHHWFHVDRNEKIYGNGYGVPTERGTYYYWLNFDPAYKFSGDGFFKEVGIHFQGRIRDDQHDRLRSWYSEQYWSYENYAYARTDWGTLKAGQVVKEFGLPWDYSWWEGTPYFDGYKFDPD